jgi:hypothetical protein
MEAQDRWKLGEKIKRLYNFDDSPLGEFGAVALSMMSAMLIVAMLLPPFFKVYGWWLWLWR